MMVIVYALGVEKGRSVAPRPTLEPAPHAAPVKAAPEIRPQPAAQTVASAREITKPYTIAVASLSKKETALSEAARMKANGFDSFVIPSPPYYVVCVGAFADKISSTSQKELVRVRRFSGDAYFKQR